MFLTVQPELPGDLWRSSCGLLEVAPFGVPSGYRETWMPQCLFALVLCPPPLSTTNRDCRPGTGTPADIVYQWKRYVLTRLHDANGWDTAHRRPHRDSLTSRFGHKPTY